MEKKKFEELWTERVNARFGELEHRVNMLEKVSGVNQPQWVLTHKGVAFMDAMNYLIANNAYTDLKASCMVRLPHWDKGTGLVNINNVLYVKNGNETFDEFTGGIGANEIKSNNYEIWYTQKGE